MILALALILAVRTGDIPLQEYEKIVVVSFSERCLTVYDRGMENKIVSYPVAVPKSSIRVKLPVTGVVLETYLDPYWYPTESIREHYKKRYGITLPKVVKPKSSQNAMGEGKIVIKFMSGGITPLSRIHGTYQDQFIGKSVSLGCIRMHNSNIRSLISIIRSQKTLVIYKK